ncbi:MAG: prepilin peptidase [Alphaproteobacteria bacterium]|nr:prepilin peptidase [Alphaproteobacteria bacterium]
MTILYVAWSVAAFALGAALGSFAALAVARIPDDEPLWSPASRCPTCRTPLAWHDNVPLASWVLLRARCRTCHTPIPASYPLVELTCALTGWLLFRRFVPGVSALDLPHVAAFGLYLGMATLLAIAAFTDVRARIIPEVASHWAIPFAIAGAGLLQLLGYDGWLDLGWKQAVLGSLVGGLVLAVPGGLWRLVLGTEGVAWGDVRLLALIGAFVGPMPGVVVVTLLACFAGVGLGAVLAFGAGRSGYLPFAPALSLGALVYVLYGDLLVQRVFPQWLGFL